MGLFGNLQGIKIWQLILVVSGVFWSFFRFLGYLWRLRAFEAIFSQLRGFRVDANLNQHALRPNKQYWNNCPRKLKFKFWWNPDPTFISETRTKGISNRPWPNDYNGIMNQRYKVWRILDKFTVLKEPKEEQSLTFSDFYSINSLLQWVHATYNTWLKIENIKNVLNNKSLNKSWFGLKLVDPK